MSIDYRVVARKTVGKLLAVVAFGISASPLLADQFHYRNLIIGDRAIGLGGAFGAVSDDASGVFYNPGGLGFALSNDVSGSANAFFTKKITYKKTLGSEDFVENSGGAIPSFFGVLQKLDNVSNGLVVAFGVFSTDSELKDQDDLITDATATIKNPGIDPVNVKISRFHRAVNVRGSTYFYGIAASKRISSSFSIGLSLNYVSVEELVQEYQESRGQSIIKQDDGSETLSSDVTHQAQNIRANLQAAGLQPVLGLQYAFLGRFSLGVTVKGGTWLKNKFEQSFEQMQMKVGQSVSDSLANNQAVTISSTGNSGDKLAELTHLGILPEYDDALGSMPTEARLGFAWFATPRTLFSFDATWHDAVNDAKYAGYQKDMVLNFATGMEYYLKPSVPIRLGLFTNNDARAKIDHKKTKQRDHIDYIGESIFLAWVQPNSQMSLGVVLQQGVGEAQKTGDLTVQEIEADARTLAFSISHSI
ncbi:MAG: hypothetical protein R3B45_06365 [Bdellovibrionota bacterium]